MQTDRFKSTVSNKDHWWEFDINEGLNTLGETARSIWGKPVENTTIIQAPEEEKDNTMLYVGIGGGALLLVVLLFVMLRK
jgi:hypothetical protein